MKINFIFLFLTGVLAQDTIREAAKGTGLYVGSALNYNFGVENPDYLERAAKEFNVITAGNACKMYAISKGWGKYDFSKCQYLVDFSKKHGQLMRGHVLIWANQPKHNAKWVNSIKRVDLLEKFMENYIKRTVKQFKNDIFAWDVVNEAVNGASKDALPLNKKNVFTQIDDYLCKAFKFANEANPNIQLFYNDYGIIEHRNKADAVYKVVKDLVDRGCPIHGVGFQAHIDLSFSDQQYQLYLQQLKRYEDLGLIVHITELDVACTPSSRTCPYSKDYDEFWPKEQLEKQAKIYGQILTGCLQAKNCESFEVWGYTDRRTWLDPGQNPTILDTNMDEKPAYSTLLDILKNFPRDHEASEHRRQKQKKLNTIDASLAGEDLKIEYGDDFYEGKVEYSDYKWDYRRSGSNLGLASAMGMMILNIAPNFL